MRLVIGRPRSLLRRLSDWVRHPLPPPVCCARCGRLREGDPNERRLYRGRSHEMCGGTYDFDRMDGSPPVKLCMGYQTYSA